MGRSDEAFSVVAECRGRVLPAVGTEVPPNTSLELTMAAGGSAQDVLVAES